MLDEFSCFVRDSRTVQVRIGTYGSSPRRYGKRAVKIGDGAKASFVLRAGWEFLGHGIHYNYFRLPDGQPTRSPVITIQVPTEAEVDRLALSWHRENKGKRYRLGPWQVEYFPRKEGGFFSDDGTYSKPARFCFGDTFPWHVALLWDKGDDLPPRWVRSYDRVVEVS